MLSYSDISRELQTFWNAVSPQNVPTQFPGVPLDASGLTCWYEFWMTLADEIPHRAPRSDRLQLLLDLHCFARGSDKRRVLQLADAAREALAQQTVSVGGEDLSAGGAGVLRILDVSVRDLTRDETEEPRLPLQHLVMSFVAVAELAGADLPSD